MQYICKDIFALFYKKNESGRWLNGRTFIIRAGDLSILGQFAHLLRLVGIAPEVDLRECTLHSPTITDQSGYLVDAILHRVHYDLQLLAPSVFFCIE